jgi:hypothetical protein
LGHYCHFDWCNVTLAILRILEPSFPWGDQVQQRLRYVLLL